MLSNKTNVVIVPKLTAEERFKIILSRPRKPNARIRLAMPKLDTKKQEVDK
jgi:hypothetical protein